MLGKQLGPWLIERELGRGGMGTVYLARREQANGDGPSEVALKVLAPELANEPGFVHRFQREIDALSRLSHPTIVQLYEAGNDRGVSYYAMEYVPGRTLGDILQARGRMPWTQVLDMAIQVCPALKHAHDHGVIHRDLKPQNLLRTDDGTIKLTDFGIAKIFAAKQLTATGGLVGTADYLSPEQAAGKPVTPRSDLYSLGAAMYMLLTGRPPFQGKGMIDLLHKHVYGQFERPQRLVPEIPPELDDVVCRLLEKNPAKRPANAQILQRELLNIQRLRDRRAEQTVAESSGRATQSEKAEAPPRQTQAEPGPSTFAAQMVRAQVEHDTAGGALNRALNRPWVIVCLLALCLGVFAWKFWPRPMPSAESLFEGGRQLMASEKPADWQRAWDQYLIPLEQQYPKHPYRAKIDELRQQKQDREILARTLASAGRAAAPSEAERLYHRGLSLCQQGDIAGARGVWQNLALAFGGMPSEERWVRLAQTGIAKLGDAVKTEDRKREIDAALQHAHLLRVAGRVAEADAALQALENLYRDDPAHGWVLEAVRKEREKPAKQP